MMAIRSYPFFLLLAVVSALVPGLTLAASSAYVQTTENLDLHHVHFAIAAPPEVVSRLSARARSRFAQAGLTLGDPDGRGKAPIATLTLTLSAQPLTETCPGHVLYTPSLTLSEPVLITRNATLMNDVTWLAHTGPQVREPVTVSDLEQDLDTFIEQFIADYRTANAGVHHSNSDSIPTVSQTDLPPSGSVTGEPEKTYPDAGLKELRADQFRISISGGRFTQALTTRALQQFSDAGYPLKPSNGQDNQVTLGVELTQRTLEDRCPGKVLYESGLYLVEQVQLARNRRVSIWSDTWLRETTQVLTPRSQQQLESDQDALLQQFIDSLRSH